MPTILSKKLVYLSEGEGKGDIVGALLCKDKLFKNDFHLKSKV